MGFKFEMTCPCCGEAIIEVVENDMMYRKCTKCEWAGLKFSNVVKVEYDDCEYCEVDVDGNNNLSSDFPYGKKINYCPMCGRKL